jgi:hypothetical protein
MLTGLAMSAGSAAAPGARQRLLRLSSGHIPQRQAVSFSEATRELRLHGIAIERANQRM